MKMGMHFGRERILEGLEVLAEGLREDCVAAMLVA